MNTIGALVKKDLLLIWKGGAKVLILLFIIYVALPLFSGADESALTLGAMLCILCPAMQMSTFSMDEAARWNGYVLSAPVTRGQLVWSKYASAFALACIGEVTLAAYMLLVYLMGAGEMLTLLPGTLLNGMLVSVLFTSLVLPIVFRFGVERGRIIFIVFCGVAGASAAVLSITTAASPRWNSGVVSAIFIAAVLVLAAVSVRISLAVFSKKEIE